MSANHRDPRQLFPILAVTLCIWLTLGAEIRSATAETAAENATITIEPPHTYEAKPRNGTKGSDGFVVQLRQLDADKSQLIVAAATDSPPASDPLAAAETARNETISTPADADGEELDMQPAPIVVSSQNFPKPYPGMHTANWSVHVNADNWTSIEVRVLFLDIDETADVLFFRAGNENTTGKAGITLTGKLDAPKIFRLPRTTELFIHFQSNTTAAKQKHLGFQLSYSPYDLIAATVTSPDPQTNTTTPRPVRDLHSYTFHVSVGQSAQIAETWQQMRVLLADCANNYTEAQNMSVTRATPANVVLQNVIQCPRTWEHHEQCVRVRFAIPLADAALNATLSATEIVDHHLAGAELSSEHLEEMWIAYGVRAFAEHQMPEYLLPRPDHQLLLWSAIGLAVVIVFLLLLYSISKMDILRDYHRMPGISSKADDRKKILSRSRQSQLDISMFPSPHQIVPSLFPVGDGSGGAAAGGAVGGGGVGGNGSVGGVESLQHEYETRPIRFSLEDFPASRAEHDKQHIFTPNIVNFNEPNSVALTTFMEEEEIFNRSGGATGTRHRPLIRDSSNHESMT